MTSIIIGFIAVYSMHRMNMSDGYIIANAILISAFALMDKLWDIKIQLTEIENAIKR
jgi:hypothetical protein